MDRPFFMKIAARFWVFPQWGWAWLAFVVILTTLALLHVIASLASASIS